jgi:beta-phosphoglucomutase
MSEIKACIFDLDGVIVDTAKYHYLAWRKLANDLGFDFTEEQNEMLKGVSRIESLKLILEIGGVTKTDEEIQSLAVKKNEDYLNFVNQMDKKEILPGVEEFLKTVKESGKKIVLGSASKNAVRILEKINLLDAFDAIIDGTKTTRSKPDPQVFLMGAEAVSIPNENCVVFEDAPKGVEAAQAAGMKTVGIGKSDVLGNADRVIPGFDGLGLEFLQTL